MPDSLWTLDEIRQKVDSFLGPVLKAGRFELSWDVLAGGGDEAQKFIAPDYTISFDGRDVDLLLEHRGELLLALEQLTLEALRVPHDDRYRLIFDARDYRLLRIEELRLSAEAAAERVKRSGLAFRFSPMTSRERRIIHLALRDNPEVETTSEGVAPNRHTVIRARARAKR